MMTVTVACVGRLKEAYWRDACAEYTRRLNGFYQFKVVEVEETRLPDTPSPAQIEAALREEGRRLLAKCPPGAAFAALCIEGETLDSPALAETLSQWGVMGHGQAVLFVGSSYGLSPEVKAACARRLSMSRMTFPHQLARVMLLEQLYRAAQIQHGGRYHK